MPDDTPPAPDSAQATSRDRTCDATTSGGTLHPATFGPCTRDRGHDAHRDANGDAWYSPGQGDARERAERAEAALAAGIPLICSDERHEAKVEALEAALDRVRDLAGRLDGFADVALTVPDRELYQTLARSLREAIDGQKPTP
jgi:alkylhydroperoxidase family enzyme